VENIKKELFGLPYKDGKIQSFCITWKDHLLVNNQIVLYMTYR